METCSLTSRRARLSPVDELADRADGILRGGLQQRLFTGAAVSITTPAGQFVQTYGAHSEGESRPVDEASLFDLASLTKTFTGCALAALIADGVIDPDEPVGGALDVGRGDGAHTITMRMLLTHTSGLPEESHVWRGAVAPRPEDIGRVIRTTLESPPGAVFRYSCVGYVAAGAVAEAVTGVPIDRLIRHRVLDPLRLDNIRFGPVDPELAVATEDQPALGRGLVRGSVHDELSWYLGGRVGNAGLFAPVGDLSRFVDEMREPHRIGARVHALMTTSSLTPGQQALFGQAFGPRVGDRSFMASAESFGHTGFTGTMWVVDPVSRTSIVLLTNRVSPSRSLVDLTPLRRALSAAVAASVVPRTGRGDSAHV